MPTSHIAAKYLLWPVKCRNTRLMKNTYNKSIGYGEKQCIHSLSFLMFAENRWVLLTRYVTYLGFPAKFSVFTGNKSAYFSFNEFVEHFLRQEMGVSGVSSSF